MGGMKGHILYHTQAYEGMCGRVWRRRGHTPILCIVKVWRSVQIFCTPTLFCTPTFFCTPLFFDPHFFFTTNPTFFVPALFLHQFFYPDFFLLLLLFFYHLWRIWSLSKLSYGSPFELSRKQRFTYLEDNNKAPKNTYIQNITIDCWPINTFVVYLTTDSSQCKEHNIGISSITLVFT